MAAFVVPILVLITGVGVGFGWISSEVISYERTARWLQNPMARLALFAFISLSLFHWAHRFRYVVVDMGLRPLKGPVALICYGAAVAGTAFTAFLLVACF